MSKLNTLKDIKKYYPMCLRKQKDILLMGNVESEEVMEAYEDKKLVDINVLKSEAIKHIKKRTCQHFKTSCNFEHLANGFKGTYCPNCIINNWIKMFFNLTEEELV